MQMSAPFEHGGSVLGRFLFIYVLCCGFQHVLFLPVFEDRVQPAEIVYALMVLWFLRAFGPVKWNKLWTSYTYFIIPCIAWLAVHLMSFAFEPSLSGLLECAGVVYLVSLLFFFLIYFDGLKKDEFYHFSMHAFRTLGWLMSISGLILYLLSISIWPNEAAQIYENYPYFGDSYRLQGLTTTPAMYLSIITLSIAFCLCNAFFYEKKRSDLHAALFFSIVALLTLAKSFLFILFLWSAFLLYRKSISLYAILFLLAGTALVHVISSHFLIVDDFKKTSPAFINSPYSSNELLFHTDHTSVLASGYYCFKKTAWTLFLKNPFHGTGPGNYNRQVELLKKEGQYPAHLPNYDPHSTYLGALAILGWPGLVSLLLIGLSLFNFLICSGKQNDGLHFTMVILAGILLAEAVSMDIMNFRHYWIFFAMVVSWSLKNEAQP